MVTKIFLKNERHISHFCVTISSMNYTVCFIGHRLIPVMIVWDKLKIAIEKEILNGCNHFIVGSHGDFDKYALRLCREFKKKYAYLTIDLVVTSLSKIYSINESGEHYFDDINVISYNIEEIYFKKIIEESNKQMIDNSDKIICYINKDKVQSGARKALNYAIKQNLQIVNLFY